MDQGKFSWIHGFINSMGFYLQFFVSNSVWSPIFLLTSHISMIMPWWGTHSGISSGVSWLAILKNLKIIWGGSVDLYCNYQFKLALKADLVGLQSSEQKCIPWSRQLLKFGLKRQGVAVLSSISDTCTQMIDLTRN
jgi:hypothetical protein